MDSWSDEPDHQKGAGVEHRLADRSNAIVAQQAHIRVNKSRAQMSFSPQPFVVIGLLEEQSHRLK